MKEFFETIKENKIGITFVVILLVTFLFGIVMGSLLRKDAEEERDFSGLETRVVEIPCFQDSLDDWSTLQMAIVMTESKFNPTVVGTCQDQGILQITPIYVKEVNRILKEEKYQHNDAFNIALSLEMFEAMQAHYNPEKDQDKAIKYHNRAGWYAQRVKENIEFIQRMEEVRRAILQNQIREQGIL